MATKDEYKAHDKIKRIRTENGVEEVFYPFLCVDIPGKFKIYAEEKLNETDESKRRGIQKLRIYLEKENIRCPDDEFIITVLRVCKYDIRKSESKLKRFLKMRQFVAEKLLKINNEKIEIMLNDMFICIQPYRDKDGRTVLITRPELNLDLYEVDEAVICFLATLLFAISFPLTSICGTSCIGEEKTPDLYLMLIICNAYRRHMKTLLDCPLRIAKIDLVNEIAIIRWTVKVLRPLLGKIAQRITFNGPNYKDIVNYYHPDIVPNEFGGNLGPLSNTFYRKELLDFIENLRAEFK